MPCGARSATTGRSTSSFRSRSTTPPSLSRTSRWCRATPPAYRDAHPSRALLIVEVAETSYRIDREHKASLYARAGLPEYWIIDLAHETLEVHRDPEASTATLYGWRFASVDLLRSPANVTPLIAAAPIRVVDLFP